MKNVLTNLFSHFKHIAILTAAGTLWTMENIEEKQEMGYGENAAMTLKQ